MTYLKKVTLPLEQVYNWEKTKADDIYLTQPMGNGVIEEYTWSKAVGEARRMASYLQSLDLPPKSNIAILSKNCAYWIMNDLAVWMAGHVTVPLYPTLNADTVKYILKHSESKVLFVGKLDDWEHMKAGVPEDLPCVSYPLSPTTTDFPTWNNIVAEHAPMQEDTVRDADELATIIYTSGSTGQPKGVMLSFYAMGVAAAGVAEGLDIGQKDRMLSYLPLAHVFERFTVEQSSLYVGSQLFFTDTLDTFLEDLRRAKPTVFISVPRLWTKFQLGVFKKMPSKKIERLLKVPFVSKIVKKKVLTALGLEYCRFAGSGSAPLSGDIISWYRNLGLELLEGYGMSENFGYSHLSMPGNSKIGYVGEPLLGVDHRISEIGEIEVNSPANMMGYFKDEAKTKESFTEDGFLLTGDKGEIDDNNRLKITGRIKEIFKTSKGKYVAPAPIENKIIGHDCIEMVCVTGAECPQPHALIMLSDETFHKYSDSNFREYLEESLAELIVDVNATLDPHEQLQFMTVVNEQWNIENEFLTPTMKIKRNIIEDTYKPLQYEWYASRKKVIWQ
jgi:long-subunit acyl-CoA synthetase (AMP-forming)